ncbi:MAG TPA: ergothioneine biosynthesis glutamate--cysteine ligase EgtA [Pilimelia sp.]|nr:ergothioneine biosynthesis glutamate--cysteine ligase EgtA [Pilimelia sp.]
MTAAGERIAGDPGILHEIAQAEGYVASVCFKTGPPALTGAELEWTVHRSDAGDRPIGADLLRAALGPHAPHVLDPSSPHLPLPGGGVVTVEPGGQVEISTQPRRSLAALHRTTEADIGRLTARLATHGLALGSHGIDPHRGPLPVLSTPRYAAMASAFDRHGPAGQVMMRCTAGLQVCVDAGEPAEIPARWEALHLLGPALLATFANARHHAGRDTGWASWRFAAWLGMDPARTAPAWTPEHAGRDPALAWARYALTAPLVCLRQDGGDWTAPPGVTFADWVAGALPTPPTTDDLDYHLGTLFPPVRPRGYLEVRYLDSQPPGEWIAPVAVVAALLGDQPTVDDVRHICAPVADRWHAAARYGLADPAIAAVARKVLDLACARLHHTDLPSATRRHVHQIVRRRMAAGTGEGS